jgi:hypothetical protein
MKAWLGVGAWLFLIFAVTVLPIVIFKFTRPGREWMLGGRILRTIGQPVRTRRGMTTTTIAVHVIARREELMPLVGIELSHRALLPAPAVPITLSFDAARTLAAALQEASEHSASGLPTKRWSDGRER